MRKKKENSIKHIKPFINDNNFHVTEQKIESIGSVVYLLGKYFTIAVSHEIEQIKKNGIQVVLDERVETYSERNIDEYLWNSPKDILEKLEEVRNKNSKYNNALRKIEESIRVKFAKELEMARSGKPTNQVNIHTRKCESAVIQLLDKLRSALELEL